MGAGWWFLASATAVVLFFLNGVARTITGRVNAHGLPILAWRYLTGQPWHGKPLTDRTWKQPGSKALTPTGHAPKFHFRQRREQTFIRVTRVLFIILLPFDLIRRREGTIIFLSVWAAYFAVLYAVKGLSKWRGRKHRRTWVETAHYSLAKEFKIPVEASPDWIELPSDRSEAKLQLPPGHHWSDPKEQERLARAAMAKLGLPSAKPEFHLAGPDSFLLLKKPPYIPDRVLLADIMDAVMAARPDELVLGLGVNGDPVKVSLHGDSPHIGISMGSGAGKSTLAAFIIGQLLFKGWISMMLDTKLISHPWARTLPNVAYAGTIEEVHDAMCWLAADLDRRKGVALGSADMFGVIHGNVGARLLITAEELNMMMDDLRVYWAEELNGRGRSPAIRAMRKGHFAGRQFYHHWLDIAQLLEAAASGGSAGRENVAVRCMSRYTQNAWKMLVPQAEFPGLTEGVGRIQVVAGKRVMEAQTPHIDLEKREDVLALRHLATSGVTASLPYDMPNAPIPARMRQEMGIQDETVLREISPAPSGLGKQEAQTVSDGVPVSRANPVGLTEAAEQECIPSVYTARNDRFKDKDNFPRPVARSGLELLYDPGDLRRYYEEKAAV